MDLTKKPSMTINKKILSLESISTKGVIVMQGYEIPYGYMGLTHNGWILFETEQAYYEYMTS